MRRMTAQGVQNAALHIGVDERTMRAVMQVESRNSGYDAKGRLLILYEPHVMWRSLPPVRRETARANGLAYPEWGVRPYPRDSYPIFERAQQFDREAACKAVSMGVGQVLGENHLRCGYTSAWAMYQALSQSEDEQLMAMARFIRSRGLSDELQRRDWAGFAKAYNGPRYAEHNYHGKLAAAWKKLGSSSVPIVASRPGRNAADAARAQTGRAVATASTTATGLAGGGAAAAPPSDGGSWIVTGAVLLGVALVVGAVIYFAMRPARVPRHETPVV